MNHRSALFRLARLTLWPLALVAGCAPSATDTAGTPSSDVGSRPDAAGRPGSDGGVSRADSGTPGADQGARPPLDVGVAALDAEPSPDATRPPRDGEPPAPDARRIPGQTEPVDLGDAGLLPPARPEPDAARPVAPDAAVEIDAAHPADAAVGADLPPPPTPPDLTRPRRRMDIGQLDRAMRQVSGGLGWTEQRGATEVNLFTELSSTLGAADYIQLTSDNLDPSPLFQKFLGDAARSVCTRRVALDLELPPPDRVFLQDLNPATEGDDDVHRRLRGLLREFHGHTVGPEDPRLVSWRWLHDGVRHMTRDPVAAWRVVCVGLFTHPDFYGY